MNKTLFVTGGAGFIGSSMVRLLINNTTYNVVNIDKLTYAGHLESLKDIALNERYSFERVDICNHKEITELFDKYQPCGILHLAAESHVDRSIESSNVFMQTNIMGTYNLLECTRHYLSKNSTPSFKFIHVSTDEVFGTLGKTGYFNEDTKYDPQSPYSSSKASSDLLVKAWHNTYNIPTIITNCTNNYGPYHYPEKLIPLVINNALQEKPLPIYGTGENIRDWLYAEDHVRGILLVYEKGIIGQTYCIGGHNEKTNLEVVHTICNILDKIKPRASQKSYMELITFVPDRLGHDYRYAMDPTKIETTLSYKPQETFITGIEKTINWYMDNQAWVKIVTS